MQKSVIFLLIVGTLIPIGIALSYYSSLIITKDFVTEQSSIISGDSLQVNAELYPSVSKIGLYFVQTMNFEENSIHAKIFGPSGSQIVSKTLESEKFEDRFEILTSGTYMLVVENSGPEETVIIGVLSYLPDKGIISLSYTGVYILIVGMIGMVGLGVFVIKNRQKK